MNGGPRSPRRRRRAAPGALRRWAFGLLSALMVVGLLARGHALQLAGLMIGCSHPLGAAASAAAEAPPAAERDDHGDHGHRDTDSHGDAGDEDCPPNCHGCACGQIPTAPPPLAIALPSVLLDFFVVFYSPPPDTHGTDPAHRLYRPPRPARA